MVYYSEVFKDLELKYGIKEDWTDIKNNVLGVFDHLTSNDKMMKCITVFGWCLFI